MLLSKGYLMMTSDYLFEGGNNLNYTEGKEEEQLL
jgi:hypothetical protein